jgi:UDP-N-acetylglucosamine--N-acetylmuramyl-(pentapeptide) pyrophosphoryl-undecaprenol N-acetylglucosamine transferase
VLVADRDFTSGWVGSDLIPLVTDESRLATIAANSYRLGIRNADQRMAGLVLEAVSA